MTRERVEALLSQARTARRSHDSAAVLAALDAAWIAAHELPADDALVVRVAWKRGKAHADFGTAEASLACLEPLVALDDPFQAYPEGLRAVPRIGRGHQDTLGYGHPVVVGLWKAWTAHHERVGDRYAWAIGRIQLAWDVGCRGDLTAAHDLLEAVLNLRPVDLEGGASRHPSAPDAASSVHHIHVDAAHCLLRPCIWAGDRDRASEGCQTLSDAMDDAGTPPTTIALEALQECAWHFGSPAPADYPARIEGLPGFRGAFGRALLGIEGFEPAIEAGESEGPEWVLAALAGAGRLHEPAAIERIQRSACAVFRRASVR